MLTKDSNAVDIRTLPVIIIIIIIFINIIILWTNINRQINIFAQKKSKTNNEVCINRIFTSYKNGAKRRGFIFEVDIEYFSIILIKNCHYCGIEPLQKIKVKDNFFLYNGIDRKNSSLGYVKNNLLPCCFICNRGKSNMNYKDFKKHLLRITDFNNNLKK